MVDLDLSQVFFTYSEFFEDLDGNGTASAAFMAGSIAASVSSLGIKIKAPLLDGAVNQWYSQNYKLQQCRASFRQFTLSEEEYKIRYGWMLPYAINLLTNRNHTFTNNMTDWLASLNATSVLKRLVPPETCTYEYYQKTYSCSFKFTGIQSLLNSDISLNALIKDCPNWDVPAIYLECEGKDCALISKPQYCTSNDYCDANFPGTKCMSLINSTANFDFVQAYFTHQLHPFDSCGSTSKQLDDLKALFAHYTTQTPEQSICFWDIQELINTVNVTAWANNQYIVNGDTFSIRDLSPWVPPTGTDTIPGTVPSPILGNISITLVYSWVLFLLMISWILCVM